MEWGLLSVLFGQANHVIDLWREHQHQQETPVSQHRFQLQAKVKISCYTDFSFLYFAVCPLQKQTLLGGFVDLSQRDMTTLRMALKRSRAWTPIKIIMENNCGVIGAVFLPESIAPPARHYNVIHIRCAGTSNPNQWRKQQLEALQCKFTKVETIQNDEELQPMWKEMEGRVTRRRPRTVVETRGKTRRQNVRKTDEEVWLAEGMCREEDDENDNGRTKNGKG
jgi:hypothetical protein